MATTHKPQIDHHWLRFAVLYQTSPLTLEQPIIGLPSHPPPNPLSPMCSSSVCSVWGEVLWLFVSIGLGDHCKVSTQHTRLSFLDRTNSEVEFSNTTGGHAHAHTCTHTRTHMHTHAHTCTHTHTPRTNTHTHTHTHTHTQNTTHTHHAHTNTHTQTPHFNLPRLKYTTHTCAQSHLSEISTSPKSAQSKLGKMLKLAKQFYGPGVQRPDQRFGCTNNHKMVHSKGLHRWTYAPCIHAYQVRCCAWPSVDPVLFKSYPDLHLQIVGSRIHHRE